MTTTQDVIITFLIKGRVHHHDAEARVSWFHSPFQKRNKMYILYDA
jgi:hypothetical protein